jgi:hypothetical protein
MTLIDITGQIQWSDWVSGPSSLDFTNLFDVSSADAGRICLYGLTIGSVVCSRTNDLEQFFLCRFRHFRSEATPRTGKQQREKDASTAQPSHPLELTSKTGEVTRDIPGAHTFCDPQRLWVDFPPFPLLRASRSRMVMLLSLVDIRENDGSGMF